MINKTVTGFLLTLHFVLTRGFAIMLLIGWVWYMSASFNVVSATLESMVEVTLSTLGINQFFTLLIMQSKPEQVILFMVMLIPLYFIFSFILYPLRHNWISRTVKMIVIHFLALITLYFLAWFAGDFFMGLMDTGMALRDKIFEFMGHGEYAERVKAIVYAIQPRTILAVILITVFFYTVYALPSFFRAITGADQAKTGKKERALFL